ncbi:MAG: glycine cleavage system aminomethyltransferase GcvT [Firmicutes bacterium]|nr:glycine cleavage system aminomethyltransferase GcvT [Bacillota bacterium]
MRATPLTEWHEAHGAKMTEFGGYRMPLEYPSGIVAEHHRVRQAVGMFDVSHMGEFWVTGPDASAYLDYLVTNRPSALAVGQALYTLMCNPQGGTLDDLLIYRLDSERFLMVVNAANRQQDWEWARSHVDGHVVTLADASDEMALIAVQGPRAPEVLAPLSTVDLSALGYYHVTSGHVAGYAAWIARTGYTGEDGFELYVSVQDALPLWERLSEAGIPPIGLGARDTLRLEAAMPLYGHELSLTITPLEAGLGYFVKLSKPDFIGRASLLQQKTAGVERKLVGLELQGGIGRAGYEVVNAEGHVIGAITSGTLSPTLGRPIALALVASPYAAVGQEVGVRIRQRVVHAKVVSRPFYRRPERRRQGEAK